MKTAYSKNRDALITKKTKTTVNQNTIKKIFILSCLVHFFAIYGCTLFPWQYLTEMTQKRNGQENVEKHGLRCKKLL